MFASESCSKVGCFSEGALPVIAPGRRARLDAFDLRLRVLLSRAISGCSIAHLSLQPD